MTGKSLVSIDDARTAWRDPNSISIGYFAKNPLTAVDSKLVGELERASRESGDNARLSLHGGPDALFHEMIICQRADRIHPPKKHVHKDKSFHIIKGALAIFVFDDSGTIVDRCVLDGVRHFVYRVAAGHYHADVPFGDHAIHHESTTGPFVRATDSIFASWAPAEGDQAGLASYREQLLNAVRPAGSPAQILLTGAGGFCGEHIARKLLGGGRSVIQVTRVPAAGAIATDLRNPQGLPRTAGTVIHAAARLGVGGARAAEIAADNVEATRRLIAHAVGSGATRFIFFSAMSVYGHVAARVVNEATPCIGPDTYGMSKLIGERMLAEAAPGLPSLSLRLPAIAGPGARHGWLTSVIAKLRRHEPVHFVNPDTLFNNAVHVDDLAEFVSQLVGVPFDGADIVTLSAREPMPIGEMLAWLKKQLESRSELISKTAPDAPAFTIDCTRAQTHYGWRPPTMKDVLARLVEGAAA